MDLALYRGPSGVYVIVPEDMRPSTDAEHQHGPLRLGMRIPLPEGPSDPLCTRIVHDVDSQCYAVLTAGEAIALIDGCVPP
jgi:hypothetical protein